MISFTLLATLALAGGPAATSAAAGNKPNGKSYSKRSATSTTTEYVAIVAFPINVLNNGLHYCLRNLGGKAGLQNCSQPDMSDALSLFTFQPAPGFSIGQGYYTMKSSFDDSCVNFRPDVNPNYLSMSPCGSQGTFVPWFFQWNTTGKNPGSGSFANPNYSVISAPWSDVKDINNLGSNRCYKPNFLGGISTEKCADAQWLTWFGYATPTPPLAQIAVPSVSCSLSSNQNSARHTCQSIVEGYLIKGLYNSTNGRLLSAGSEGKAVSGLSFAANGSIQISFSITPHGGSGGNIAEFYLDSHGSTPILSIGLASNRLDIFTPFNSLMQQMTSPYLTVGKTTKVTIEIKSERLYVLFDDSAHTVNAPFIPSKLSFSSPPIDSFGAVKGPVADVTIGPISIINPPVRSLPSVPCNTNGPRLHQCNTVSNGYSIQGLSNGQFGSNGKAVNGLSFKSKSLQITFSITPKSTGASDLMEFYLNSPTYTPIFSIGFVPNTLNLQIKTPSDFGVLNTTASLGLRKAIVTVKVSPTSTSISFDGKLFIVPRGIANIPTSLAFSSPPIDAYGLVKSDNHFLSPMGPISITSF